VFYAVYGGLASIQAFGKFCLGEPSVLSNLSNKATNFGICV